MTLALHGVLPIVLVALFTRNPVVLHLAGVFGIAPDLIPLILWDKYRLVRECYNRFHRPWVYGYWWMYIIWAIFPPLGLHCLMDIPFHTDTAQPKNLKLMVLIEIIIWVFITFLLIKLRWLG